MAEATAVQAGHPNVITAAGGAKDQDSIQLDMEPA
jgi:hypothetical protein